MTAVFDLARELGHERVLIVQERAVGLRAVIAIHDTTLGRGDRRDADARPTPRSTRRSRTRCGSRTP